MSPQLLSNLLLDLYATTQQAGIGEHPLLVLQRLQRDLPFDCAWWGMATVGPDGIPSTLHWSQPMGLSPRFVADWRAARSEDALARALIAHPGRTLHWGPEQLGANPGLAALVAAHGLQQALSTVRCSEPLGLLVFVSLYRQQARPRFTAAERALKQLLMPHLDAMLRSNWLRQVDRLRLRSAPVSRCGLALVDAEGLLHVADDALADLLGQQWPGWTGPRLPPALCQALAQGRGFRSQRLIVRQHAVGELWCLEVATPAAIDVLSPRESEVARRYSAGASHKEVARGLGLAPATVRHQLREIYRKLGVNDKAALASRLLGPPPQALALATLPPRR